MFPEPEDMDMEDILRRTFLDFESRMSKKESPEMRELREIDELNELWDMPASIEND